MPEEEIKNIAERVPVRLSPSGLRYLRSRLYLTQLEFAYLLGYEDKFIVSRWENGKINIPKPVQRICELLQLVSREHRKKFIQKHIFPVI